VENRDLSEEMSGEHPNGQCSMDKKKEKSSYEWRVTGSILLCVIARPST